MRIERDKKGKPILDENGNPRKITNKEARRRRNKKEIHPAMFNEGIRHFYVPRDSKERKKKNEAHIFRMKKFKAPEEENGGVYQ